MTGLARQLGRDARGVVGLALRVVPGLTLGNAALRLVLGMVPVCVAWLTKLVLDRLGSRAPVAVLVELAAALAALAVVTGVGPQLTRYLRSQLDRAISLAVLERLFTKVNGLRGIAAFENPQFLDRLRLAQQSTTGVPGQVLDSLLGIASALLVAAGFVASLFVINPWMVLIVLAGAGPALAAELSLSRRRAATLWRVTPMQRREMIHSMLLADSRAAKEIRLFGIGDYLFGKVRRERVNANCAQRQLERRDLVLQVGLGVIAAATAGGGLIWAVVEARAARLTFGDVTMFVAAVGGIQIALVSIISAVAQVQQQLLTFRHFAAIETATDDLVKSTDPVPLPALRRGIELRDVWFRYSPDLPWSLRGVNLFLPAGTSVALVGENGAGKSTLVKLLCRFYDPTRGAILWDGVDLRDLDPTQLRRRIGVVFQDFMQYDMTAAENIAVGDLAALADPDRLVRAAGQAGVHEVLARLPRGYDTMLTRTLLGIDSAGDKDPTTGVPLSGGQWQRLALARALLRRDAELLILDEPSSGLDAEAEHEMHTALAVHRTGATSVLVSHRLSAVRDADRIVVLAAGEVAEYGDHSELLAASGRYARLFGLQARGYQEEVVSSR